MERVLVGRVIIREGTHRAELATAIDTTAYMATGHLDPGVFLHQSVVDVAGGAFASAVHGAFYDGVVLLYQDVGATIDLSQFATAIHVPVPGAGLTYSGDISLVATGDVADGDDGVGGHCSGGTQASAVHALFNSTFQNVHLRRKSAGSNDSSDGVIFRFLAAAIHRVQVERAVGECG